MADPIDDAADTPADVWAEHAKSWRDPAEVIGFVGSAPPSRLAAALAWQTDGPWWDLLQQLRTTLLISREYEHLLVALAAPAGTPEVTFLQVPHPSGIAFDRIRRVVHVACTRNPNQVLDLVPSVGSLPRADRKAPAQTAGTLLPVRSRYLPGSLYLHDLAMIDGQLYGNAVGHNAIVRLPESGGFERVWWPGSIEDADGPDFTRNHLQLNSIASGPTLAQSWFTASGRAPGESKPGDLDYPVDGRGVAFDGSTREARVENLTRPHSARLHEGALWIDNSGYGEVRVVDNPSRPGELDSALFARLPGWTRGLAFVGDVAFVGTSRVIPRFSHYAPGLSQTASICGLHALDTRTGTTLASLIWPGGNQIFAIEPLPATFAAGLPGGVDEGGVYPADQDFYYSAMTEEMQ